MSLVRNHAHQVESIRMMITVPEDLKASFFGLVQVISLEHPKRLLNYLDMILC